MDGTINNESMPGGGGGAAHPQSHFTDHQLAYFDQGARTTTSHSLSSGGVHDGGSIDPQSHPIKSAEGGSPPPNSATTSGSTSTPTSGESSGGGDGKHGDQHHHHVVSTSHFHQPIHPQTTEGWSVSVGNMIPQTYHTNAGDQTVSHAASAAVTATSGGGEADTSLNESQTGKYDPSAYSSAIKLLVSNNVAGSIIGRAGQTISELQTESSARIKLSQTGDYYPGTQDRVCLVQGSLEHVKKAVQLLLERLHMLQEQQHKQSPAWQAKQQDENAGLPSSKPAPTHDFNFIVRVLVPSSSCGMIIGKAGANIKHLEESSGVSSVRLSPKESGDPNNPTAAIASGTGERVVTLSGSTLDCCTKCVAIILDGMSANQEISRYTNLTTSYSRLIMPGPFAHHLAQPARHMIVVPAPTADWDAQGHYGQFSGKRSLSQQNLAQAATIDAQRASQQRLPPGSPNGSSVSPDVIPPRDSVQQLASSFHDGTPPYGAELGPAMVSTPPNSTRPQPSNIGGGPMYLVPTGASAQVDHSAMSQSSSAPDLLALQFQDSVRVSNPPTSAPLDYSHFAPQLPQPTPPGFTAQVLVPDNLVGSILGRGGRALNDLQMHSNTRIRISQRGEYMPGTRNRIVTIRGPTAHSVSWAQYLMSQRMVIPPTAGFPQQPTGNPPAGFAHPSQIQPTNRFPPQHATNTQHQHPMAPLPQNATGPQHSLHLHHQQQHSQPISHTFGDSAFLPTSSTTVPIDSQASAMQSQGINIAPQQGGGGPMDLPRT